ncbi:MAG: ABC transporter substrate-binding protein [Bifidobacteriaceae bacterium]|jgi:polar amino acid transport system substrate-binding protein|nr:ABC transporter substrate-binding protein [Bifidobacteriaceae bacterium]
MFTSKVKWFSGYSVVLVVMLAVSACSGGANVENGSSSVSQEPKPYNVEHIQKDDAVAALLPDSIIEKGTIETGTEAGYAPAEFVDDNDNIIGFDVDLSNAIGKVLGVNFNWHSASFDSLIASLGTKYDIAFASMFVTPERLKEADFITYDKVGSNVVVQKGNPKGISLADFCGITVAVQKGTQEADDAESYSAACKSDGKSPIEVLIHDAQTVATNDVITGKADATFATQIVGDYAVKITGDQLESLGIYNDPYDIGIAVKKSDSIENALQQAIQKLIDTGEYQKIVDNWGLGSGIAASEILK